MFKLKLRLLSVFVLVSMLAVFPTSSVQAFGKTIRVSATPPTGPIGPIFRRCGDAWGSPCGLQQALSIATTGDAIWIAEGTYKPTTTSDRTISFTLKNGVALYGGFAGTETALEQRDPFNHVTILSGDIGSTLSRYDNSYHVVISSGVDSTSILDGVTITGGQSDGLAASNYDKGAGLLNISGSPTLNNITVSGNNVGTNGYGDGAGMYSTGDPTITNTIFSENRTSSYGHGGGMYSNGNPLIMDVTFRDNWACGGGGLYSEGDPIVTNITFSGNEAANGAGMYNWGDATLTNVTFSGNTAMYSGGGLELGSSWDLSYPTLTNVTFTGNSVTNPTSGKGGAIDGYNSHMVIHNGILWGNMAAIGPEIYQAGNQSINIIYSVVAGGCPAGGICAHIYTADPRLGVLGNYGGFTQTIPLLRGSSAMDQALDASCPFTDQRGVDRPQGKRCDIGAYEVLEPVKPGIYDDTHPAWFYAGTWTASQGTGTYNNTLHQTRTRGSYAEITFYGAQVQLMYLTGPDRGLIDVSIDGGKYVGTIDANTLLSSSATWTSPVWDAGVHTVRFQVASRGWIDMDAIQVLSSPPVVGPGTYDDTDANWKYTGTFTLYASSGAYQGSIHYTTTMGDYAEFTFTGSQISLLYTGNTNRGTVDVFVDGNPTKIATIDQYTASAAYQKRWTSGNLGTGTHTIKFVHAGPAGTTVNIDAIEVGTYQAPSAVTYDDLDSGWTYTGTFTLYASSGAYQGGIHYTTTVGDYAEFTFTGSQFVLVYTGNNNRGTVDVFVDGSPTKITTIDQYTASAVFQQHSATITVGAGLHTLKLIHAGPAGTTVNIDAIEILP